MNAFADLVASALDTNDAMEAGRRVHAVLAKELTALDPEIRAETTGYFNHSFIPDLVMHWTDRGRRLERPVFLRHSLASSRAAGDLGLLAQPSETAFFLSLSPDEPVDDTATARAAASEAPEARVAVTTVPALDELTANTTGAGDPVLGIVRASVVRSAKGVFVEDDVEKLVLPRERRISPDDLEQFNEVVRANFSADAVVRIDRVARIVERAIGEDPGALAQLEPGALSPTEIRELVPYLLRLEGVTQDREFWLSIASLIKLEEIEKLWDQLENLDIAPLARAGALVWRASRAQLSSRADAIDDEDFDRTPTWRVRGRRLVAEVGDWRIDFAGVGRKLRTADRGLPAARWAVLRPSLNNYTVTGANLAGVVARSDYDANEAVDMKSRIDSFIESADDSFHVTRVDLSVGVGDDRSQVTADFSERMLRADPSATVGVLARVALDVLGHQFAVPDEDVTALFAGPSVEADADLRRDADEE